MEAHVGMSNAQGRIDRPVKFDKSSLGNGPPTMA
jgi:hypothetical protein